MLRQRSQPSGSPGSSPEAQGIAAAEMLVFIEAVDAQIAALHKHTGALPKERKPSEVSLRRSISPDRARRHASLICLTRSPPGRTDRPCRRRPCR